MVVEDHDDIKSGYKIIFTFDSECPYFSNTEVVLTIAISSRSISLLTRHIPLSHTLLTTHPCLPQLSKDIVYMSGGVVETRTINANWNEGYVS